MSDDNYVNHILIRHTQTEIISSVQIMTEDHDIATKEYVDTGIKKCSKQIIHLNKLIETLMNQIKTIEKKIAVKDLATRLNKHYEQSGRRK